MYYQPSNTPSIFVMEICLILHYQGLSQFKPLSTPICANYLDSSHVECSLMKLWFKWISKEFNIIILICNFGNQQTEMK